MAKPDAVREALAELEDAINADGFGCACMPDVKCATCKARDLMSKWVRPSFEKLREALSAQPAEPVPVGYLPAYELARLRSGHSGNLRSAKFGPSKLDDDVAVYTADKLPAATQPAPSEPAIPEGWQLVPKEPTSEMVSALHCEVENAAGVVIHQSLFKAARAMLAAAPHPAAKGEPT